MAKDTKPLYKPFPTTVGNFKYQVWVKSSTAKSGKKLIGFGHRDYGQYRDKIGHYRSKDHGDKDRRKSYLARHGRKTNKDTAGWWAQHKLW
tara:strand:+ start:63 stop:335 length:273 start_codon:yes stop_codon:yes gene_type:complete